MLSQTCQIAIKAAIFLASQEEGARVGMREIAKHINASEHTVGKTMQTLVRQGHINSQKGPSGGFYMLDEQKNASVLGIIETIEGKDVFNKCGLGLSECSSTEPCPIHHDYKPVRDALEKLFKDKKVLDLCEPYNEGLAYLKRV